MMAKRVALAAATAIGCLWVTAFMGGALWDLVGHLREPYLSTARGATAATGFIAYFASVMGPAWLFVLRERP